MHKPYTNILSCPNDEQIKAYARSNMPQDMMHLMEKHMLFCTMCSDYAEGMEALQQNDFTQTLKFSPPANGKQGMWRYYLSAAAVVFIILLSTRLWIRRANETTSQQSMKHETTGSLARNHSTSPPAPLVSRETSRAKQDKKENLMQQVSSQKKHATSSHPAQSPGDVVKALHEEKNVNEASSVQESLKNKSFADIQEATSGSSSSAIDLPQQNFTQSANTRMVKKTTMSEEERPLYQSEAITSAEDRQEGKNPKELDKTISDIMIVEQLLKNAKVFYDKGEWNKAARCLEKVFSKNEAKKMDDNNRWMLANCFIRLGKINKAIEQYELLEKPGSIFEKQASDSILKYKNSIK
jgi:hypothetical protein